MLDFPAFGHAGPQQGVPAIGEWKGRHQPAAWLEDAQQFPERLMHVLQNIKTKNGVECLILERQLCDVLESNLSASTKRAKISI